MGADRISLKPCYSKKKKENSLEANALLLARATTGFACLHYLTTCCSLAGADRLQHEWENPRVLKKAFIGRSRRRVEREARAVLCEIKLQFGLMEVYTPNMKT